MVGKPVEQLKLHSLSSFGPALDLSHHIGTRWEVVLEIRLSSSLHVCEDSLPEMPSEKRVQRTPRVAEKTSIQGSPCDMFVVWLETNDLMTILDLY